MVSQLNVGTKTCSPVVSSIPKARSIERSALATAPGCCSKGKLHRNSDPSNSPISHREAPRFLRRPWRVSFTRIKSSAIAIAPLNTGLTSGTTTANLRKNKLGPGRTVHKLKKKHIPAITHTARFTHFISIKSAFRKQLYLYPLKLRRYSDLSLPSAIVMKFS